MHYCSVLLFFAVKNTIQTFAYYVTHVYNYSTLGTWVLVIAVFLCAFAVLLSTFAI